ncbi:MAG TPA: hypothetical protein VNM45_05700 [Bacillus sp. (in: firmicutes)]|nr:hypothetical protein [Bacillus sp. (in: firmicutes)]
MCEICNDKHVIHQVEKSFISVVPCPNNCGPSVEERERKMDFIANRIREAERRFKKENVAV